jgi:hypothetical protein
MGRRRKAGRETVTLPGTAGTDEQLLVVSPKVATHAKKAEKESRKAARAERKLAEAERKAAEGATDGGQGKDAKGSELTGAKVKRYIGIARIVVPVVAPIVYQAVGSARSAWDQHRARQLGVAPDELGEFSGRGAGLYARVHHLALSARDLRTRRGDDGEVRTFVAEAEGRLSDLESAVRAAEQMPASRRRSAHAAVGAELDRLESRLLVLWGVDGSGSPALSPARGSASGSAG